MAGPTSISSVSASCTVRSLHNLRRPGPLRSAHTPIIGGKTYCYLSDGAGNVAGLTDGSGTLVDQYSYDPMGNITSSTTPVANPFTFQGAMYDSATGVYYTGSGYYDPANGQSFGCQDQGWVDPGEDRVGRTKGQPVLLGPPARYRCPSWAEEVGTDQDCSHGLVWNPRNETMVTTHFEPDCPPQGWAGIA